jgi:hypothetical protein
MTLATRLFLLRADLTRRRAARKRRQRLERDIAYFGTPAERQEFLAMCDRYPDGVTQEVRDVLDRHIAHERFQSAPRHIRDVRALAQSKVW